VLGNEEEGAGRCTGPGRNRKKGKPLSPLSVTTQKGEKPARREGGRLRGPERKEKWNSL